MREITDHMLHEPTSPLSPHSELSTQHSKSALSIRHGARRLNTALEARGFRGGRWRRQRQRRRTVAGARCVWWRWRRATRRGGAGGVWPSGPSARSTGRRARSRSCARQCAAAGGARARPSARTNARTRRTCSGTASRLHETHVNMYKYTVHVLELTNRHIVNKSGEHLARGESRDWAKGLVRLAPRKHAPTLSGAQQYTSSRV